MNLNWKLILPKRIDNVYKGNKIALYAFWVALIITIGRSLAHMFLPDGGAQSIATIPLDTFGTDAANAVIFMFAYWGLSQLLMGIFYLITAVRYRSLIPLMYIFLFIEYTMRFVIGQYRPLTLVGTAPGGVGNKVAVPIIILMFLMSILQNTKTQSKGN